MNRPCRRRGFFSHGGYRGNRDSRRAPQEGSLLCVKREYLTQRHEGAKKEKLDSRFRGNDGGGAGMAGGCGARGRQAVCAAAQRSITPARPSIGIAPADKAVWWKPRRSTLSPSARSDDSRVGNEWVRTW